VLSADGAFLKGGELTHGEAGAAWRRQQSAGWPTDPAFSRNPKPPALAGGVFTRITAAQRVLARFRSSVDSGDVQNRHLSPIMGARHRA
jgi:hypothetical protein